MDSKPKLLLLDDELDFLEIYEDLLSELPSRPSVKTTTSGSRALAIIESEPIRLFLCDLKMPKMDGLQVLSIVRRRFPDLRTVVLTSLHDEHFRSRAYALGVDMYWQKPTNEEETRMFLECMESLLGHQTDVGFRGLQSKSLVDIIQMECLSQSSSVLRITHGAITAKVWIEVGDPIDAEVEDLRGEAAFHRILSWKTGGFETMPPEPGRLRTIEKSCSALLLESAQTIDETHAKDGGTEPESALANINGEQGVEFAVVLNNGDHRPIDSKGLDEPGPVAKWTNRTLGRFSSLGDELQLGPVELIDAQGHQRNISLGVSSENDICFGWRPETTVDEIRAQTKKILASWGS
jgi:CheY-like chemotaxis protein